jgi:Flp pilus assembly protein TadG
VSADGKKIMFRLITRALWQDQRGSAIVEGTIVVPVLLTFLLGLYEFSWAFYQQQLISTGLRDAARYLARYDYLTCGGTPSTSCATAVTNAKAIATTGAVSGGTAMVKGWTTSNVTVAFSSTTNTLASSPCGTTPCRSAFTGVVYTVTVSTNFQDPTLGLFGALGLTGPSISVSHTERVIGAS